MHPEGKSPTTVGGVNRCHGLDLMNITSTIFSTSIFVASYQIDTASLNSPPLNNSMPWGQGWANYSDDELLIFCCRVPKRVLDSRIIACSLRPSSTVMFILYSPVKTSSNVLVPVFDHPSFPCQVPFAQKINLLQLVLVAFFFVLLTV